MANRFDKQHDLMILDGLRPERRVAVAAAALERMSIGYRLWALRADGRDSADRILQNIWGFVSHGSHLPEMADVERLYPSPDESVTFELPYAESFLEALQLFTDFAATREPMRLIEVRQGAYNMAYDAAGDATIQYSAPGYNGQLTLELEQAISFHPWVSRELDSQTADVQDARTAINLDALIDVLRARAIAVPVVSESELEEIRSFQAG
ncbi:hypothetical protein [Luteibacter sp. RCC_6_2]|uniref:hypothetical protein n=1 Tax=Luteibacter sp. RCC_6_2 TaxID=3239223 RepID=UPI0035249F05